MRRLKDFILESLLMTCIGVFSYANPPEESEVSKPISFVAPAAAAAAADAEDSLRESRGSLVIEGNTIKKFSELSLQDAIDILGKEINMDLSKLTFSNFFHNNLDLWRDLGKVIRTLRIKEITFVRTDLAEQNLLKFAEELKGQDTLNKVTIRFNNFFWFQEREATALGLQTLAAELPLLESLKFPSGKHSNGKTHKVIPFDQLFIKYGYKIMSGQTNRLGLTGYFKQVTDDEYEVGQADINSVKGDSNPIIWEQKPHYL
jgi:hypothetical protein